MPSYIRLLLAADDPDGGDGAAQTKFFVINANQILFFYSVDPFRSTLRKIRTEKKEKN